MGIPEMVKQSRMGGREKLYHHNWKQSSKLRCLIPKLTEKERRKEFVFASLPHLLSF